MLSCRAILRNADGATVVFADPVDVQAQAPEIPAVILSQYGGTWFDPSDTATLFVERTGASATTPASINGPVGTMLDKHGTRHATAPSDAARPILRQSGGLHYLEFDGVDDCFAYDGTGLVGIDFTLVTGILQRTSPGFERVLGGTASAPNQNMHCGWLNDVGWLFNFWGNDLELNTGGTFWTPSPYVFTHRLHSSGRAVRRNGVQIVAGTNATKLSAYPGAHIGRAWTSGYPDMNFYGHVAVEAQLGTGDMEALEGWMSAKAGIA